MNALAAFVKEVTDPRFIEKVGARHGARDRKLVQDAHDSLAKLVDCAHCEGMGEKDKEAARRNPPGQGLRKRGARHSAEDMTRIQKAHGLTCELGAACPSPNTSAMEKDG